VCSLLSSRATGSRSRALFLPPGFSRAPRRSSRRMGQHHCKADHDALVGIDLEAGEISDEMIDELFTRFDRDRSGVLEKDEGDRMLLEFCRLQWEAQEKAEQLKETTESAAVAGLPLKLQPPKLPLQHHKKRTKAEEDAAVEALWMLLDVNRDGVLTRAEVSRKAVIPGLEDEMSEWRGHSSGDRRPAETAELRGRFEALWSTVPLASDSIFRVRIDSSAEDASRAFLTTHNKELHVVRRKGATDQAEDVERREDLKGPELMAQFGPGGRTLVVTTGSNTGLRAFRVDGDDHQLRKTHTQKRVHGQSRLSGAGTLTTVRAIIPLGDQHNEDRFLTSGLDCLREWKWVEGKIVAVRDLSICRGDTTTEPPGEREVAVTRDGLRMYVLRPGGPGGLKLHECDVKRDAVVHMLLSDLLFPDCHPVIALSPDETRLIIGCYQPPEGRPNPVLVFNIEARRVERTLDTRGMFHTGLSFLETRWLAGADGRVPVVFVGGEAGLIIVDLTTCRPLQVVHTGAINALHISKSGEHVAVATDLRNAEERRLVVYHLEEPPSDDHTKKSKKGRRRKSISSKQVSKREADSKGSRTKKASSAADSPEEDQAARGSSDQD
jgi:hypothetical protein